MRPNKDNLNTEARKFTGRYDSCRCAVSNPLRNGMQERPIYFGTALSVRLSCRVRPAEEPMRPFRPPLHQPSSGADPTMKQFISMKKAPLRLFRSQCSFPRSISGSNLHIPFLSCTSSPTNPNAQKALVPQPSADTVTGETECRMLASPPVCILIQQGIGAARCQSQHVVVCNGHPARSFLALVTR